MYYRSKETTVGLSVCIVRKRLSKSEPIWISRGTRMSRISGSTGWLPKRFKLKNVGRAIGNKKVKRKEQNTVAMGRPDQDEG